MIMKNERQDILNPAAASLNVVVAYDDVCSGIEAKDLCDRLGQQLESSIELKLDFWSFASLQFAELAPMAAEEAIQAHLLIISVHGKRDLDPTVKTWLNHWSRRTQPRGRAIVAQFRGILKMDRELSPAYGFLKHTAECGGVEFFSEVVATSGESLSQTMQATHGSAQRPASLLNALHLSDNQRT